MGVWRKIRNSYTHLRYSAKFLSQTPLRSHSTLAFPLISFSFFFPGTKGRRYGRKRKEIFTLVEWKEQRRTLAIHVQRRKKWLRVRKGWPEKKKKLFLFTRQIFFFPFQRWKCQNLSFYVESFYFSRKKVMEGESSIFHPCILWPESVSHALNKFSETIEPKTKVSWLDNCFGKERRARP